MQQRGTTLVESVTVLGVVAVLASIAIPGFSGVVASNRDTAAANLLVASLQRARTEAVTGNRVVALCPSADGSGCSGGRAWESGWIVFRDDDGNGRRGAGEALVEVLPPLRDVRVGTSAGRTAITYDGRGASYGSNATFTLCRDGRAVRRIVLNNTGRTRTEHVRSRSGQGCG